MINNNNNYLEKLRNNQYDFLDFGCSSGGSIEHYEKIFRAKGLGLDIDPKKVKLSIQKGFDAIVFDITKIEIKQKVRLGIMSYFLKHIQSIFDSIVFDITKIELKQKVRFCIMSHFLEHIPSIKNVKILIEKACFVIDEFLIIRQPYFDADHYLFINGFKFFWSDWTGHSNHMTLLNFYNILKPLKDNNKLKKFSFYGLHPVIDSNNDAIHNLDSPTNQHAWNKQKHSVKNYIKFSIPIYKEILVIVDLNGSSTEQVISKFKTKLYPINT